MKRLETILLRLAGCGPPDLVADIRRSVEADGADVRIYRRTNVAGDLAVHIQLPRPPPLPPLDITPFDGVARDMLTPKGGCRNGGHVMTSEPTHAVPDPFRRRVGAERAMLMLPMNVVMSARVAGAIDEGALRSAVAALRERHALLAVRVEFHGDGAAWYVADGVPETPVRCVLAEGADDWENVVREEWRTAFPLETGPLVRVTLVRSGATSHLVVTGHHVVCDGTSLTWLIRDILTRLADPTTAVEALPPPPPIDATTVPEPREPSRLARWVVGLVNARWQRRGVAFGAEDRRRMLAAFWRRAGDPVVLCWALSAAETGALVERCRREQVTVNAALWAAFLAAQHGVQGERPTFRRRAGLAVSTRDRLKRPVGETLGFFASSLSLRLRHHAGRTFWDAARQVHGSIGRALERTDLFRMLAAEALPPTLLDALYFAKYDGLESRLAKRLLAKMRWDRTSYGYSITNVGRVAIATDYGPLQLEAVFGPLLYSDVNEKLVGVTTVGGRLTFALTCHSDAVGEDVARRIEERVVETLARETGFLGGGEAVAPGLNDAGRGDTTRRSVDSDGHGDVGP